MLWLPSLGIIRQSTDDRRIRSQTLVLALRRQAVPISDFFSHDWFPAKPRDVPFGDFLNQLFFDPRFDNRDFPIHGPNVVRFAEALLTQDFPDALFREPAAKTAFLRRADDIDQEIGINRGEGAPVTRDHPAVGLLRVCALYHDIGKTIRRESHPQLGAHLLSHFNQRETKNLVDRLGDVAMALVPRPFALVVAAARDHDEFGVISTGEGGYPILSDIIDFANMGEVQLKQAKARITYIVLLTLADIAAVNRLRDAEIEESCKLAMQVFQLRRDSNTPLNAESAAVEGLHRLMDHRAPNGTSSSCLGLSRQKVVDVLHDWSVLMDAIATAGGNRTALKRQLLEVTSQPANAIERIHRLFRECADATGATALKDFISLETIESDLVAALGDHQFQYFCRELSVIAKLDYAQRFFQAVMCGCIRKMLRKDGRIPSPEESISLKRSPDEKHTYLRKLEVEECNKLKELKEDAWEVTAQHASSLFVRVFEKLIRRFSGVLDSRATNPHLFQLQLRELTGDPDVCFSIINLLCLEDNREHIALMWIADEVGAKPMD